ncbi:unnamed protein product [Lota lota]
MTNEVHVTQQGTGGSGNAWDGVRVTGSGAPHPSRSQRAEGGEDHRGPGTPPMTNLWTERPPDPASHSRHALPRHRIPFQTETPQREGQ